MTTDQSVSRVQRIHTLWPRVTTLHPVPAMLDGLARTVTAQAAWLASTSPLMGHQSVCGVEHTPTPRQRVMTLRPVSAMLVGWDETATVQHAWLANIRPSLGLLCALTVSPGNIQIR